jgi:hypothetical protein
MMWERVRGKRVLLLPAPALRRIDRPVSELKTRDPNLPPSLPIVHLKRGAKGAQSRDLPHLELEKVPALHLSPLTHPRPGFSRPDLELEVGMGMERV